MDAKEKLIKNILIKLSNIIPVQEMGKIEDILAIEFNGFKVESESTKLSIYDDSNIKILKNFILCKHIEGLSENTLKRYYDINIKFINFVQKPIDQICCNDIRYYLGLCKNKGNSSLTLDGIRRCFSTFWNWLVIEGYIDKSPCLNLRQIKYEKIIKKCLTDLEMDKIRKSCANNRDKALLEFMYSTGMRVSEVSKCNIEDINLETKECVVKYGKGGKQRLVYFSNTCANKLKRYLEEKDCYSHTLFGLSKNGIENIMSKLGIINDIHLYPHKLRRSCATQLIKNGMGIESVAKLLGHSSVSTTQIYIGLTQDYIKDKYMKCMN